MIYENPIILQKLERSDNKEKFYYKKTLLTPCPTTSETHGNLAKKFNYI